MFFKNYFHDFQLKNFGSGRPTLFEGQRRLIILFNEGNMDILKIVYFHSFCYSMEFLRSLLSFLNYSPSDYTTLYGILYPIIEISRASVCIFDTFFYLKLGNKFLEYISSKSTSCVQSCNIFFNRRVNYNIDVV